MSFVDQLPAELKTDILRISELSIETNDEALKVFQDLYDFLTTDSNKKRKVPQQQQDDDDKDIYEVDSIDPGTIIFQIKELSFQSPLRKKLNLTFSISPITQKPILSIGKSNQDKPDLVIDELNNKNIKFSTFLPVPEKKNLLYFVIFYEKNLGDSFNNEPIVLTLNQDQVNKQLISEKIIKENDDFKIYIQRQAAVSGFKIVDTFQNGLNSFFVSAHRGTKEGLLYFLPNHILFGFKKPILLFDSQNIDSISYSSITRVTFNVTLVLKDGEKFEFSMIDQSDFANIDNYIKNKEVQDRSMSDELKAKKLTKNQDAFALAEAEGQLPEGVEGVDDIPHEEDDDDENDETFQGGAEIDDTSDVSDEGSGSEDGEEEDGEEDEDDDEEGDEDQEIDLNSDDD
ncbi:Histone chaperone [Wickerhamomyces ciferrii]|uniref:Histone chaperone RTT106 n=1 Tax=Wickerhamomyces ciferrii (strain ATCC 14091 / BCRC 22168 / CBS 111 / JCM 3599 / NBRC 0793 / NRRL Y-1031 F-60-10) TaxID=1206466 RepID=K0KFZ5_WICCF|nr:Histone chaperone [Wickerhamomyces ciferrii]CCH41846.1 Histone chaperone [Wickerhamomyces ciferrii]